MSTRNLCHSERDKKREERHDNPTDAHNARTTGRKAIFEADVRSRDLAYDVDGDDVIHYTYSVVMPVMTEMMEKETPKLCRTFQSRFNSCL